MVEPLFHSYYSIALKVCKEWCLTLWASDVVLSHGDYCADDAKQCDVFLFTREAAHRCRRKHHTLSAHHVPLAEHIVPKTKKKKLRTPEWCSESRWPSGYLRFFGRTRKITPCLTPAFVAVGVDFSVKRQLKLELSIKLEREGRHKTGSEGRRPWGSKSIFSRQPKRKNSVHRTVFRVLLVERVGCKLNQAFPTLINWNKREFYPPIMPSIPHYHIVNGEFALAFWTL